MAQGRRTCSGKPSAQGQAAEAEAAHENAAVRKSAHSGSATRVFAAAPAGWTRYMDPATQRIYLYCDETGEWYWEGATEELESSLAVTEQPRSSNKPPKSSAHVTFAADSVVATISPSNSRPAAPAIPQCSASVEQNSSSLPEASHGSDDPVIVELASKDPIVRDLVRDEMKLRKKLREISALEAAQDSGEILEAAQLVKVSKKDTLLADLSVVREQLFEAKNLLCPKPPSPREHMIETTARRRGRKPQQQKQAKAPAVNPLPQAGRSPMPVHPAVAAAMPSENSASRIAAFAPPMTAVLNSRVRIGEASSATNGYRETQASLSLSDFVHTSQASRPPCPKQAAVPTTAPSRSPPAPAMTAKPAQPVPPLKLAESDGAQGRPQVAPKPPPPLPPSVQVSAIASASAQGRPKPPPIPGSVGKTEAQDENTSFTRVERKGVKNKKGKAGGCSSGKTSSVGRSPFAPKPQDVDSDDEVFW